MILFNKGRECGGRGGPVDFLFVPFWRPADAGVQRGGLPGVKRPPGWSFFRPPLFFIIYFSLWFHVLDEHRENRTRGLFCDSHRVRNGGRAFFRWGQVQWRHPLDVFFGWWRTFSLHSMTLWIFFSLARNPQTGRGGSVGVEGSCVLDDLYIYTAKVYPMTSVIHSKGVLDDLYKYGIGVLDNLNNIPQKGLLSKRKKTQLQR